MIVLYLLGGFFALLLLLLLIPVSLQVSFTDDLSASAHYLFVKIPLFPIPEAPDIETSSVKKKKKETKKIEKEQKKEQKIEQEKKATEEALTLEEKIQRELKKLEQEPEVSSKKSRANLNKLKTIIHKYWEQGQTIWDLFQSSKSALYLLKRHLIFYKIRLFALVGGEEAHTIGKEYAAHCALITTGLGILSQFFRVRSPALWIQPDFLAKESDYDFSFRLKIRPLFVLCTALMILFQFLKHQLQSKPKKGGTPHEPKKSNQ